MAQSKKMKRTDRRRIEAAYERRDRALDRLDAAWVNHITNALHLARSNFRASNLARYARRSDRIIEPSTETLKNVAVGACDEGRSPLNDASLTDLSHTGPNWPDPMDFRAVPIAEAIARVNAAGYFVLTCNGDIYKINLDGGITLQRPGGFNNVFACRYARDDDDKLVSAGIAWRRSSLRREYNQIGYWPNDYNRPPSSYNLWRGWGLVPHPGDWSIIHDHILDVIANDDHEKANYILDWCAHMIQRPWEKPGVALVLKGRMGTGKTLLTSILARLVGPRNTFITDTRKRLFAKYNWHLADKVLIGAEEAFFAGQRKLNDRLKHLLTGQTLEIEQKFGNCISMKSMHRMIMTSNHGKVVKLTKDERRFFVCEVSDKQIGNDRYFAPLWRAANGQDDATLAAFMYELETRDIRNWKPEEGARRAATLHFQRQRLVSLLKLRATSPI